METSATSPTLFDIMKFTVEVILIGGLGLAWKIISDWQKQLQDLQKEQREYLLSVSKPALESEAGAAIKVAFEYYRPVLDAIRGVDVYAETYEIMEETIDHIPIYDILPGVMTRRSQCRYAMLMNEQKLGSSSS